MNKFTIEAKPYEKYDVVVCGGGTAGCFAAIAAAREGKKTLMLERTFTPGGMLTIGEAGITKFTEHCKDVGKYKSEVLDVLATEPERVQVVRGLAREYSVRMLEAGVALGTHGEPGSYIFSDKEGAIRTMINMLDEAGVSVLYDTRVVLTSMDGERIRSVVVANKSGFTEIEADVFIDATGDGDVAVLAGADANVGACQADIDEGSPVPLGAMQAHGTMYRVRGVDFERLFAYLDEHPERFHQHEFGVMSLENVKESYRNGEMCVFRIKLMELNPVPGSLGLVQIYNLPAKDEAILLGPLCGSYGRNSNGLDAANISYWQHKMKLGADRLTNVLHAFPGFENAVTYYVPDIGVRETRHIVGEYTITALDVVSGKYFDDTIACGGHPVDIHPLPPEIDNMDFNHWRFYIPYRALIPRGVSNLLVAGRCVSATRIAAGAIRPTAQCIAMGEAAGIAAAMLVGTGTAAKDVDIKALQTRLREVGAVIE